MSGENDNGKHNKWNSPYSNNEQHPGKVGIHNICTPLIRLKNLNSL